jgi:hypothetical protein
MIEQVRRIGTSNLKYGHLGSLVDVDRLGAQNGNSRLIKMVVSCALNFWKN